MKPKLFALLTLLVSSACTAAADGPPNCELSIGPRRFGKQGDVATETLKVCTRGPYVTSALNEIYIRSGRFSEGMGEFAVSMETRSGNFVPISWRGSRLEIHLRSSDTGSVDVALPYRHRVIILRDLKEELLPVTEVGPVRKPH
jgi:hypothetical protein